MEFGFYKIHTARNDLILANFLSLSLPEEEEYSLIAKACCSRRKGIGGNGFIFLVPGKKDKAALRFFDSRGKEHSDIYDPLICAGKYLFDSGFFGQNDIALEYGQESKVINIIDSGHFRIGLGTPRNFPDETPLIEEPEKEYSRSFTLADKKYSMTPLKLNFPLGIFFTAGEPPYALHSLSRTLQEKGKFKNMLPAFVTVYNREEIFVRSWPNKKTVDYASICSGAYVASVLQGFTEREGIAHCQGGSFFLQLTQPRNQLFCTGEAEYAFSGSYYYEPDKEEI